MHFDWNISLPTMLTVIGAVGGAWLRVERRLNRFLVEHEMLVDDYCRRHGSKVRDLPTRSRSVLG
jgi:hypothetical protein